MAAVAAAAAGDKAQINGHRARGYRWARHSRESSTHPLISIHGQNTAHFYFPFHMGSV